MIFWCQSCGEQHTSPHVTSANITTCARCGGSHFATREPVRQSLSQEAVRDEALEEAARACESITYGMHKPHDRSGFLIACDEAFADGRRLATGRCAKAIRALKREPNAAATAELMDRDYRSAMGLKPRPAPPHPTWRREIDFYSYPEPQMPEPGLSGRKMCEVIAWAIFKNEIAPEEIWNASPTGELWHVFAFFAEAEDELAEIGLGPRRRRR